MDRITWVTRDCFNAIEQLRRLQGATNVPAAQLHERIRAFVDACIAGARQAGYGNEDVQAITYALCALADEVVLTQTGPLRDFWIAQPLQILYFSDNQAGENFFRHLETIRTDPRRVDVLRVYYLCLAFGFQGRYRVRGAEVTLVDYLESIRRDLARALPPPEVLSPDANRPDERLSRVGRRFPAVSLAVGLLACVVLLYAGMYVALTDATGEMLRWMSAATRG